MQWTGRQDSLPNERFFQRVETIDVDQTTPSPNAYTLIGFASDEGVKRNLGRIGAAEGPTAIRQCLANLPFHDQSVRIYDTGDIHCHNQDLETAQRQLAERVEALLKNKNTPIVLGGGHEVAWGHYQGIAAAFPNESIGIINFDAHFDLRPLLKEDKGSSGTPFLQIANHSDNFHYLCLGIQKTANTDSLFKKAEELQVQTIFAEDMLTQGLSGAMKTIKQFIAERSLIYLTVCLDVFAHPVAPGVSAPQANGLYPWHVLPLIEYLAESSKVISFDIAELAPKYDIANRTAALAANIIVDFIHHHQRNEK